jgi:hypothetical protein
LPDDVGARAELLLVAISLIVIEAAAEVDRDGRQDLPLVLQIDALGGLGRRAVVGDVDRLAGLREAAIGREGWIAIGITDEAAREGRRGRAADPAIMLEECAEAQRVRVREVVGTIDLGALGGSPECAGRTGGVVRSAVPHGAVLRFHAEQFHRR